MRVICPVYQKTSFGIGIIHRNHHKQIYGAERQAGQKVKILFLKTFSKYLRYFLPARRYFEVELQKPIQFDLIFFKKLLSFQSPRRTESQSS